MTRKTVYLAACSLGLLAAGCTEATNIVFASLDFVTQILQIVGVL